MKPFSFTRKEEAGVGSMCERAAKILPKCKKKKRFRARPVPKNLFTNYFYDKIKEENFFRLAIQMCKVTSYDLCSIVVKY